MKLFFAGDFVSKPSTSMIEVDSHLSSLIRSCDYANVNFEVPLKPQCVLPQINNYERFFQNDDAPQFLHDLGFNLFSIATNHMFDWGEEGFQKTKKYLDTESYGAGTRKEAYSLKIVEKDGVKVGLMALCYASRFGVFDNVREKKKFGCAYINDLVVNHNIIEAKKTVDYLFVLPHDGIEYIDVPLPEIRSRYKDFIDYGADAIIGTHPHCPQGWEEYKGKPIFYSLGNFFFNSKEDPSYRAWNRPHWYEGLCLTFDIDSTSIRYNIVNTRNEGNVKLLIDSVQERDIENEKLCEYLKNDVLYDACLNDALQNLWENQESIVLDGVFHYENMRQIWKSLIKKTIKYILGKRSQEDSSVVMLLKNDCRRSVARRYMEQKYLNFK